MDELVHAAFSDLHTAANHIDLMVACRARPSAASKEGMQRTSCSKEPALLDREHSSGRCGWALPEPLCGSTLHKIASFSLVTGFNMTHLRIQTRRQGGIAARREISSVPARGFRRGSSSSDAHVQVTSHSCKGRLGAFLEGNLACITHKIV